MGHTEILQGLLDIVHDINVSYKSSILPLFEELQAFSEARMTPLHYAARSGHADAVKLLVAQKNIDMNALTSGLYLCLPNVRQTY